LNSGDLTSIFTIPKGVDRELFYRPNLEDRRKNREKLGIRRDEIILISVGSLDYTRELENIIIAYKNSLSQLRTYNTRLFIIGDGPDYYHLLKVVEEYELTDKIVFIKYVPHNKIPDYLTAADIGICYLPIELYYVQPSLKILEYLACGLPTIATKTYFNDKYIMHNWNGLIIEDNHLDLTRAINSLVKDKELRDYLSSNAILNSEKYNWEFITKNNLLPNLFKIISNL